MRLDCPGVWDAVVAASGPRSGSGSWTPPGRAALPFVSGVPLGLFLLLVPGPSPSPAAMLCVLDCGSKGPRLSGTCVSCLVLCVSCRSHWPPSHPSGVVFRPVPPRYHLLSASFSCFLFPRSCFPCLPSALPRSLRPAIGGLGNGMITRGTEIMQVQHKHETIFGDAVCRVWLSQGRDSPRL
jgi:hypothetical protein